MRPGIEPASNQLRASRSILESSLNYSTAANLEHDGFLVTNFFHWDKTKRMRDLRGRNITDDLKPDENQPLGNILPDYKVSSGERYKLLTNDELLVK